MERGWWKLEASYHNDSEVTDTDKEHIAKLIKEGFTEGELIKDD